MAGDTKWLTMNRALNYRRSNSYSQLGPAASDFCVLHVGHMTIVSYAFQRIEHFCVLQLEHQRLVVMHMKFLVTDRKGGYKEYARLSYFLRGRFENAVPVYEGKCLTLTFWCPTAVSLRTFW